MAGLYTVTMANQTVIADSEMVILRAATSYSSRASVLRIYRMWCSQAGTATSQQLGIRWGQRASTFGTFTSTTPAPVEIGTVASGISGSTSVAAASAGTDASTNSSGTFTTLGHDSFNNLNGWQIIFVPEERPLVAIDLAFALQLQGTPTTLTNWSAGIEFEEVT